MTLKRLFENRNWDITIRSGHSVRDRRYKISGNVFQLIFTLFRIVTGIK